MTDVIKLSSRRPPPDPNALLKCDCGSTLFRLVPRLYDDATSVTGAVAFNQDWAVVAWSGVAICNQCYLEQPQPWETDE